MDKANIIVDWINCGFNTPEYFIPKGPVYGRNSGTKMKKICPYIQVGCVLIGVGGFCFGT